MLPDAKTTAFVFPGQGSQAVGMGRELASAFPEARQVFEQADQALGFSLSKMAWEGPEEALNDTINTQPALLVHSVAALRVFQSRFPGYVPAFAAGHSMGELSALVACGALDGLSALKLVRRRGELMKMAGDLAPGAMAAILGLDIPTLEDVCAQASAPGEIVQVANDNCPGQVVISGARAALERAVEAARARGARRAVILAVSIAAHSPLMRPAQQDFNQAVQAASLQDPITPLVGNITAAPLNSAAEIQLDLQGQLESRVRWTESVQTMAAKGVTTFVEIGSGSVLGGLIKRIQREANTVTLGSPTDFAALG